MPDVRTGAPAPRRRARPPAAIRSLVHLLTALALLIGIAGVGGCAVAGGDTPAADAPIRVAMPDPEGPLYPSATYSLGSIIAVHRIFAGLVAHDPDGGAYLDDAESVEPDEGFRTWTITLREGLSFADGEPVTADSYIRAWEDAAYGPNNRVHAGYFSDIDGFERMRADAPGGPARHLRGLERVDERTFRVHLTRPLAAFRDRLAAVGFKPLPAAALADPEGFGEHPVGNGPYRIDGEHGWERHRVLRLRPNPSYRGPNAPENAGLDLVFGADPETAWADLLAGTIDVATEPPADAAGEAPGGFADAAGYTHQALAIPMDAPHFRGAEGRLRRAAISLAIDRAGICATLLDGLADPAAGPAAGPALGGRPAPGAEVLRHDPGRARRLWARAEAISEFTGTLPLAYAAGDSRNPAAARMTAVADGLRGTLGVDARPEPYPSTAALTEALLAGEIRGPVLRAMAPALPVAWEYYEPAYATGGSFNRVGFSDPEVDAALAEAAAGDPDAAATALDRIAGRLLAELPDIPLWDLRERLAWGPGVAGVTVGWDGFPVFHRLRRPEAG
ncbi:hypothetical protein CSPHI_01890 [Corynebacterium sphenisci DSM 44792]|uniref:Solute-binding protein family 5 domain-containing protein n=1 Tax=Corynebacterium sphenisci DSM 44792 TaxID=1437874 RepID=A0A1L7CW49_9CORY|nr:ABC transporter substrate-binding protein [Corynebacterium sphenisci]APT90038.1 hypothetical protein CSPHI_01890 [Corynebacterium sphenisci DSM 44792]